MDCEPVGPGAKETPDDLTVAEHGREHERGPSSAVVPVDIGPGIQEQSDQGEIPLEGDAPKGCLSSVVSAVDVSPGPKKHAGRLLTAVVCRKHQEGIAAAVAEVHGHSGRYHVLEDMGFPFSGKVQGYELELGVSGFLLFGEIDLGHGRCLRVLVARSTEGGGRLWQRPPPGLAGCSVTGSGGQPVGLQSMSMAFATPAA
jgi:hypothetical protein